MFFRCALLRPVSIRVPIGFGVGLVSAAYFTSTENFALAEPTNNNSKKSGKANFMKDSCHDPVCKSKSDFFKKMVQRNKTQSPKSEHHACPADREELGRHTWTLLHTICAYFPERPNEEEQKRAENFVSLLAHFYPCKHCAAHMREYMEVHPLKAISRTALSTWMCQFHNEVNELTGSMVKNACG